MNQPTRQLEKYGLKFTVLVPSRWSRGHFAGICMANGCDRDMADTLADTLIRNGTLSTTVRVMPEKWESFKRALEQTGIHVEEIPPL